MKRALSNRTQVEQPPLGAGIDALLKLAKKQSDEAVGYTGLLEIDGKVLVFVGGRLKEVR